MNKKLTLLLGAFLIFFPYGCKQNLSRDEDFSKQRPYRHDPVISLTSTPSEGWATDPNLSYRLYGYWPINYYNNNLYQTMGLYGLPYR